MIKDELVEILNNMGLQIVEYHKDDLIKQYIHDSLALVSFLIFVEDQFHIEIEADYFNHDFYERTFGQLEAIIAQATDTREKVEN